MRYVVIYHKNMAGVSYVDAENEEEAREKALKVNENDIVWNGDVLDNKYRVVHIDDANKIRRYADLYDMYVKTL